MSDPSLADYLFVILRHWKSLVAIVLLHLILAVAVAVNLKPIYRSEMILAPVPDESNQGLLGSVTSQIGGLAQIFGASSQAAISKNELVALLGSKELARDFIAEYRLVPMLYYKIWDAEAERWDVDDEMDIPSEADSIRMFQENVLSIAEARRTTGLVTVAVEWVDREVAAVWARRYVQFANDSIRQRVIIEAQKSREYLQKELDKTSVVELRMSIYSLIESQVSKIMIANVREEYAFRVIDSAFVADEDQYVSPNRPLIVLFGLFFGAFVGIAFVLLRSVLFRVGTQPDQTAN